MPTTLISRTIHVPGSGNPEEFSNHTCRALLNEAARLADHQGDEIIIYDNSLKGRDFLKNAMKSHGKKVTVTLKKVDTPGSIPAIAALIVAELGKNVVRVGFLTHANEHIVVISWPYAWRMRSLLRKYWKQWEQKPSIQKARPPIVVPFDHSWQRVCFTGRLTVYPVGDTLVPYWQDHGLRAIPWWLKTIAIPELIACWQLLAHTH